MTLDLSNPDRLPFRDLPDDVAAGMVNAWRKGAALEYFWADKIWEPWLPEVLQINTIYRIRPAPVTADVIPWAALHPQWRWAARDKSAKIYAFQMGPNADIDVWQSNGRFLCLSGNFAGVIPGTCSWRDSLQQRPEGV